MYKKISFFIKRPILLSHYVYYYIRSIFITEKYDLIIIDDVFPNPISSWRHEEFLMYLDKIDASICVLCTGSSIGALHQKQGIKKYIQLFGKRYPNHKLKVKRFEYFRKVKVKHAYLLFLDNTSQHLQFLSKNNIPFSFTLYPGAGLFLNQKKTKTSIVKIEKSNLLKNVITTQTITTNYLLDNNLIPKDKIKFIYGVVTPTAMLNLNNNNKEFFINDNMNIAFVANKQMKGGIDKGYDTFMEAACILAQHSNKFHFHIIGPWEKDDYPTNIPMSNLKYYGMQFNNDLITIYKKIDLIVSPNKPFILKPGAFDGFPTAACSEAALCRVAMMITDPLNLNIHFTNNKDIIIIKPEVEEIIDNALLLLKNPQKLISIATNGEAICKKIYSFQSQIAPRIKMLEQNIKNS